MFGAISYDFMYWIFFGAVLVLIVLGASEWLKDKGIVMNWWKWIILAGWYILSLVMFGAPFTLMGEAEVAAGWRILGASVVVIVILGFVVYRLLLIGKSKTS